MSTWRERAACRGEDPELFFPDGHGFAYREQIETAKKVCASCPVRSDCLMDSLTRPEKYGIYGGFDEEERARLRRNDRRRARPLLTGKGAA